MVASTPLRRRTGLFVTTALLALAVISAPAKDHGNGRGNNNGDQDRNREQSNGYRQVNLVSDEASVALLQDTNLVNAWGTSLSGASPFWVSANGTGKALLYTVTNHPQGVVVVTKVGLEVTIPGKGTPTGQVFNGQGGFNGDIFLFVSEDGTVSGWRPALGSSAEVLATRASGVYKGVTLTTSSNRPVLLAANFAQGTIDEYDTNAALIGKFSDTNAPAGYAPFNVQQLEGMVFVSFAKQDTAKHDHVPGPGHGLLDVLNPDTGLFTRLVTGSDAGGRFDAINSPWGLAITPGSFGSHADQLLVANFGSGTIMSFDDQGRFQGLLEGPEENPLVIDGLWGLTFGNAGSAGNPDTLFFSAGPDGKTHGLFGSIQPEEEETHGHGRGHGRGHGHGHD